MRASAAAIVFSLASASSLASIGCKRFRRAPPLEIDAGVSTAPTSTASARIVGTKPGSEGCEDYVVVGGAGPDSASVCITDVAGPLTIEMTSAIPAVTTSKRTIDPKELVLDVAQKELAPDAPKVTSPLRRGELTFALSKRAATAIVEKMLDDFANGKSKNPIPKSSAAIHKGKDATLVFLKLPEHALRPIGDALKEPGPGARVYLRYDDTGKVRDFDKVVIARHGDETKKGTCRYQPLGLGSSPVVYNGPETFPRVDVAVDVSAYDRGADTSTTVKHFAPSGPCPMGIDMTEVRDKGSVRVVAPLDKQLEYVRAI